jgi:hypothetical protein
MLQSASHYSDIEHLDAYLYLDDVEVWHSSSLVLQGTAARVKAASCGSSDFTQ